MSVVTLLRAYATGQQLPPAPMGLNEKAGVALLLSSKSGLWVVASGPALAALLSPV